MLKTLNFALFSRAFVYVNQILTGFVEAKDDGSPGGRAVTPLEIVGITAKVSSTWAQADGVKVEVTLEELIETLERAGWTVLRDGIPNDGEKS